MLTAGPQTLGDLERHVYTIHFYNSKVGLVFTPYTSSS